MIVMAWLRKLYTTPVICRSENSERFVFFRFWKSETKQYKQIKCAEDPNRIKDPNFALRPLSTLYHEQRRFGPKG
jgi:hypothetical protein